MHLSINQLTFMLSLDPSRRHHTISAPERGKSRARLQCEGGNRAMAHGALGFKRGGWTGGRMQSFVNWTPGGGGDAVEEVGRAEGAWTGGLDGGAGDRGTQP
ncbi:hypothetical protein KC19_9G041900 [Ceratodon purpureus]|uniref:Uncharacterized protein n=1 Tax=Ceratodon purpureus TaxID=3225 RepID=A0A8T0GNK3_CERPU|nr:hypothetical protein KC19_9G041900 [Ceratodon purpureus]